MLSVVALVVAVVGLKSVTDWYILSQLCCTCSWCHSLTNLVAEVDGVVVVVEVEVELVVVVDKVDVLLIEVVWVSLVVRLVSPASGIVRNGLSVGDLDESLSVPGGVVACHAV